MPGTLYGNAISQAFNKEIDWDSDAIKLQLHTSTYTPADAHDYQNDLTNEVANANGYVTGGVTLGSRTRTYTVANSWGTSRANTTAYAVGDVVRPATGNGFIYQCVVAGTSGGTVPTWSTVVGQDTTDGTVTWTNMGTGIVVLSSAAAVWTLTGQVTFRYAVIVDTTPGTTATNPLIGYQDFTTDQGGNSQITVSPHATLGWFFFFSNA
jgi:hypothetical protein